jgi:hypothetical protein
MSTMRTYTTHDDYMTPKSAWDAIKHLIPKGKVIWEAFYCDGTSGRFLSELGFEVVHENVDFYTHDLGDIIVSNPPFSDAKNVLKRLLVLDKPFILTMPSGKISTQYFRQTFKDKVQIIIPADRIQFTKLVDGAVPTDFKSRCSFDCFYYCYQIGLEHDITWL